MRVTMYTQVGTEPGQRALWGHKRPCTRRGRVLWRLRSHTQGLGNGPLEAWAQPPRR